MPAFLISSIQVLEITLDASCAINSLVRREGWRLSDVGQDGGPRRAERISDGLCQQLKEMIMAGHDYV
jgi:hypothetical protein